MPSSRLNHKKTVLIPGAPTLAETLERFPRTLLATSEALLGEDSSATRFSQLGLDAQTLGRACAACLGPRLDLNQVTAFRFLKALAHSDMEIDEHWAVAAPILELWEKTHAEHGNAPAYIALFELHETAAALGSPAAEVWLRMPFLDFDAVSAWRALMDRPDLARAAIQNPKGFLSGQGATEDPFGLCDLSRLDPALLAEALERRQAATSIEDAVQLAVLWLSSADLASLLGKGHRKAVMHWLGPKISTTEDWAGELSGTLVRVAFKIGDADFVADLARIADSIVLLPDHIQHEVGLIHHPGSFGGGGISFPLLSDGQPRPDVPKFTLADYALGMAGRLGPGGESEASHFERRLTSNSSVSASASDLRSISSWSAALDFLAQSLREQNLDQAPLTRGTPSLLADLAEIGAAQEKALSVFPKIEIDRKGARQAFSEAVSMRVASMGSAPAARAAPKIRI